MRLSAVLSLAIFIFGLTFRATQQDSFATESKTKRGGPIVTETYKVADLPVWTSEKKYDPLILMRLIQASVSPSEWEAEGGNSTMVPYRAIESLVISTPQENHARIVKLLESMRPKK
jgi:hypothetical protein